MKMGPPEIERLLPRKVDIPPLGTTENMIAMASQDILRELRDSSARLVNLTWALVGLTVVLAVLTGILVYRTF